jgi:16S rRNA (guanine1516-N2)-methyltransferase
MADPPYPISRTDLFITTALKDTPALEARALEIARELGAPFEPRHDLGLPKLFEKRPGAARVLIVQADRLLLVNQDGGELFYHPNMAFPRLGNVLRGDPDPLLDAAELRPGDSVLDGTLGFAAEAILCSYAIGETGEIHGVEAVPELGIVVREGMRVVVTDSWRLNEAMRRIQMVHLGHHLDYLRICPDDRYDVICFDPFFDEMLEASQAIGPLRTFGSHLGLLPDTIAEARRVARRRILVKAERRSDLLTRLDITARVGSRSGKVDYGVIDIH